MKRGILLVSLYVLIIASTLVLAGMILGPVVYWAYMPSKPLDVWIVDKTVPIPDYREHKGLMWVLNHSKVIYSKTEGYFRYASDYFGFYPVSKGVYKSSKLPFSKENPDLIYLTDTYGVYTDDYLTPNTKGTQSDLIAGGLDLEDLNAIKASLGEGNTIIGEFNIASAPTNEDNRKALGSIFGVNWTGWKGRYFKDLTKNLEVPESVVNNYEKQHGSWKFSGEGYVLVSDNDEVAVLEAKKHYGNKGLKIAFNKEYSAEFAIKSEIPYEYWFEFIKARPGREVIAEYKLDVTQEGKALLEQLGLSEVFPAAVRYRNSQYNSYYFAGDFADIQNASPIWKYYGYDRIKEITSSISNNKSEVFYWRCYVPVMKKIINDLNIKKANLPASKVRDENSSKITSRAIGKSFYLNKNGQWMEQFIKGVNLGAALPGRWFTEFPEEEELYLKWLGQMGEMNANSIRVYTLLPPEFYNALLTYNKAHTDKPIYLFQEIWPEENPSEGNYLDKGYTSEYQKEIEKDIDAIHGKARIPERKGRAYGIYTSDVSDYVLGYLIGRELEPDEVINTNKLNDGFTFAGQYLASTEGASPTEAWLAMNCDYAMQYEEKTYQSQHPLAIVSWPTLDPLQHDSEWNISGDKSLEYNDKVAVDINHINIQVRNKAGLFGAYHIYPNYPDFMNNETVYASYTDDKGRLRYGGYLKEFIGQHTKYPALVAEFGLATGMGNAHSSPDGYHHGSMTEEQQGDGIVRMMKAIKSEGYAGGIIFEWMDEWSKKTWITEPYIIPYDRHALWHNVMDPEQNYGILSMESQKPTTPEYRMDGKGEIKSLELSKDETYLYLDINLKNQLNLEESRLLIGLDTYARDKGEFIYSSELGLRSVSGLEFLVDIKGKNDAKLLVHPDYNVYNNKFSSKSTSNGIFEEIRPVINKERMLKDGNKTIEIRQEGSILNCGELTDNSSNSWYISGNTVQMRIPWSRLNFSDPSSLRIINDESGVRNPIRDQLKTAVTEGIYPSVVLINVKDNKAMDILDNGSGEYKPYLWKGWNKPRYVERLKKSYYIIKDLFEKLQ